MIGRRVPVAEYIAELRAAIDVGLSSSGIATPLAREIVEFFDGLGVFELKVGEDKVEVGEFLELSITTSEDTRFDLIHHNGRTYVPEAASALTEAEAELLDAFRAASREELEVVERLLKASGNG